MAKKSLYTRDKDVPINAEGTFEALSDVLKRSVVDEDAMRKELKELEEKLKNSKNGILPEEERKRKSYLEDTLINLSLKKAEKAKAKTQAEEVKGKEKEYADLKGSAVGPFDWGYDTDYYQIDQNLIHSEDKFHDAKNFQNILNPDGSYKKEYVDWVNGMTQEKFDEFKKRLASIGNIKDKYGRGFKTEIDTMLSWDLDRWKERALDGNLEHTHTINNALYTNRPIKPIGLETKPIDTKIKMPPDTPPDIDNPQTNPPWKIVDLLPLLLAMRDKPDYRLGADLRRNSSLLSERSSPKVYTRFNPIYSDYSAVAENTPKMMAAAAHRDDSTSATTGMRMARALANAGIKERMAVDAQNIAQRNHMAQVQTDVDKFNASQTAHDNARNQQVDMARLHQANLAAQADDTARTLASQANSDRINSLIDMLDKRRKEAEIEALIDKAIKDGVLNSNFIYRPQ